MGFFATASNSFFNLCSTLALAVNTFAEWTAYILHLNYVFVTNIYSALCTVLTASFAGLDRFLHFACTVCVCIFDFLTEIYACFCALLVLLWRICVLLYKIFCLLFTGVETLIVGLWNGGVLTYKALHQSAMDVVETCESTSDYISMMGQDFVVYVCGILTSIGNFSTFVVRGLWAGLGYVPATLSLLPAYLAKGVSTLWSRCTMWVSFAFMGVTRETYLGIIVCCLLYMAGKKLAFLLHNRGLTLFPFRRRRQRRQTDMALFAFDRGFESDIDDADDVENDVSGEESDNGENSDENGSEAQTELTLSDSDSDDDENSAGSESDVSLNSQTFSSEESDHDIEVELPSVDDCRLRNRSRSSTPSRNEPKDLNRVEFEREMERERDKRKCVVCQDASKSVLILPCKHMCLCVVCANQIVRSRLADRRICPLCRTRIERVMDVYV